MITGHSKSIVIASNHNNAAPLINEIQQIITQKKSCIILLTSQQIENP
jgi:hypothetical protein